MEAKNIEELDPCTNECDVNHKCYYPLSGIKKDCCETKLLHLNVISTIKGFKKDITGTCLCEEGTIFSCEFCARRKQLKRLLGEESQGSTKEGS